MTKSLRIGLGFSTNSTEQPAPCLASMCRLSGSATSISQLVGIHPDQAKRRRRFLIRSAWRSTRCQEVSDCTLAGSLPSTRVRGSLLYCLIRFSCCRLFTLRRKVDLQAAGITHVLSVLRLPVDEKLFEPYHHQVVEVNDTDDENLIEHFPSCNRFIDDAFDAGGAVLVHW